MSSVKQLALGLTVVPLGISNAYVVGDVKRWFLVDSGLPGEEDAVKKATNKMFGSGARPDAIVLTHGHVDHSGSARALADTWQVPIYASRLELPFLSGKAQYPPLDPAAPGLFSALSRLFTQKTIDVGSRLTIIDEADPFPGLAGWQTIPTPGHSPGHLCFFHKADSILLAGDAITTMDTETLSGLLTKKRKISRPPIPATTDWNQAAASVAMIAALRPAWLAAGHGNPIHDINNGLQEFADRFQIPKQGRYVQQPAQANKTGYTFVPPAPADHTSMIAKSILVVGIAAGLGLANEKLRKRSLKKKT